MIDEMERESNGHAGAMTMMAFLAGATLGAAGALLLAPKTGRESREQLRDYMQKAKEKLRTFSRESGFPQAVAEKVGEAATDAMDMVRGERGHGTMRKP